MRLKNRTKKTEQGQSTKTLFLSFMKHNYRVMLLFVAVLLGAMALSFMDISARETVVSFSLDDYEIGQIADRTIYAEKSLPADMSNTVAVEKGEKITRKGFPITEEDYRKLEKMAVTPVYVDYRAFGNSVLFLMLLIALWLLLFSRQSLGRRAEFRELLLQGILFLIVYGTTVFAGKTLLFSSQYTMPVIIPSALSVFLVAILFGQISATYFSFIIALCVFGAARFQPLAFLFELASCLCASRIICHIREKMDMIFASLMLSVLNIVFMIIFRIMFSENFLDMIPVLAGLAFNGFVSGILAIGLLVPLETILNTASVFRLRDLNDVTIPALKKLQVVASGTYNHSMMVANLAESAANEIGANGLLARIAAYYHDIGKMDQPEYFTENLPAGTKSAHDGIKPSLSISVIRSHVKKGVEKARAMHLPRQIIDIIAEHHGNSVIEWFYRKRLAEDPSITPEDCRYDSVPPSTRESAVVMLADVSEAACKSLDNPTGPGIEKFLGDQFDKKIHSGQLDNCDLTFRDLAKIKAKFVEILTGYYHTRIKYPGQKDPDSAENKAGAQDRKPEDEEKPNG